MQVDRYGLQKFNLYMWAPREIKRSAVFSVLCQCLQIIFYIAANSNSEKGLPI